MPYIKQEVRKELDSDIESLAKKINDLAIKILRFLLGDRMCLSFLVNIVKSMSIDTNRGLLSTTEMNLISSGQTNSLNLFGPIIRFSSHLIPML